MTPIFYDTETTGVQAKRDRIIELAAYSSKDERTFSMLINPGKSIPPEASAIHHITDDMVADAPTFAEVLPQFVEFCGDDAVLIAHNNDGFDKHFMREEFNRCGEELPPWKMLDTLKWARRYRPDLPRHSLQFLRETYGFDSNQAHRALDDVVILYKVYEAMTLDLSIEQVVELMETKRAITQMPFGKHRGKALSDLPKDYLKWLHGSGALDKPDNTDLREAIEALT